MTASGPGQRSGRSEEEALVSTRTPDGFGEPQCREECPRKE